MRNNIRGKYFIILIIIQLTDEKYYNTKLIKNYSYKVLFRDPVQTKYIFEGEDASISEFPYMVSLQKFGSHACGGTLIQKYWVLTAAHCVMHMQICKPINPSTLKVVGSTTYWQTGRKAAVKKILPHAKFDCINLYDIALLKLSGQVGKKFSNLPKKGKFDSILSAKKFCTAVGWGNILNGRLSRNLQKVVTIITVCNEFPPSNYQFCTNWKRGGICKGDSGGPLICNGFQMGIVSKGPSKCGRGEAIWTRVDTLEKWIRKTIKNGCGKNSEIILFCFLLHLVLQYIYIYE